MAYIALKTVKFDRSYNIGELIPNEVIASDMMQKLIKCRVIQEELEQNETSKELKELKELKESKESKESKELKESKKSKQDIASKKV